jgi:hypothetical protein
MVVVRYRIGVQGDRERDREEEAPPLLRRARPLAGPARERGA